MSELRISIRVVYVTYGYSTYTKSYLIPAYESIY